MKREQELVENTAVLAISTLSARGVNFIFYTFIFPFLLKTESYGNIDAFTTITAFLVALFGCQIAYGLFRFMLSARGDRELEQSLFTTTILFNCLEAAVFIPAFFLLRGLFALITLQDVREYYDTLSEYTIFIILAVIEQIFISTLAQFLRGLGQNKKYAFYSFFTAVATAVGNLIFVCILKKGAEGAILGVVYSNLATIICTVFLVKPWKYLDFRKVDFRYFRQVLQYSVPLIPNQLAQTVINLSDRTVIGASLGTGWEGIYAHANKIPDAYQTCYSSTFSYAWSESSSLHFSDRDRNDFFTRTVNTVLILFAGLGVTVMAAIPFLYHFHFISEKYAESYYQIPILMLGVYFEVAASLYGAVYTALKKSSEIAKTSVIAAVINLAVDLLFVKQIGIYAGSLSTLLAWLFMSLYRGWDVRKYISIRLDRPKLVLAAAVTALVIALYYTKQMGWCALGLGIALIYAVMANRTEIKAIWAIIARKLHLHK